MKYFARISDSKRYFSGFTDTAIAADCRFIHFFWILDFACNKVFLPGFRIQGEILMADLVNKYNGSADLHSSLPSINNCFRHQFLLYSNVLFFHY